MSEPVSSDEQEDNRVTESDPEVETEAGIHLQEQPKDEDGPRFTINPHTGSIKGGRPSRLVRGGPFSQSMMASYGEFCPLPHRPYVTKYVDSTGCFHWVPDTPIERVKFVSFHVFLFNTRNY